MLDLATKLLDLINKFVQIAAYTVGAWWILWNFLRNRTNVPRLNVSVGACIQRQAHQTYLLASMTIENPSQRVVKVALNDSYLLISKRRICDAKVTTGQNSKWDLKGGDYAFKWQIDPEKDEDDFLAIEPGTTIAHEQLVELDYVGESTSFLVLLWINEWTKRSTKKSTNEHSWRREHPRAARLFERVSSWWRRLFERVSRWFGRPKPPRLWRATKVVVVDKV